MKDRKSALISAIIEEHVASGQTVASKAIVDNHDFSLSPATIRNEMGTLEKDGYIYQPHTSAGRIPTEKGWKFYIENFLKDVELDKKHKQVLDQALAVQGLTYESIIKNVAKGLAELSKDAVFVGFGPDNFYYTGLSHLFKKPEFQDIDLVRHMSEVVDHLDEVVKDMFDEIEEIQVMVGSDNPFGKECSSIVGKYKYGDDQVGLFGILGPMRMDYDNNLALLKYAKQKFSESIN